MSKNAEKSAFPLITNGREIQGGLTKREYFAAMAMQGMIIAAVHIPDKTNGNQEQILAKVSINLADAILAELDKQQP